MTALKRKALNSRVQPNNFASTLEKVYFCYRLAPGGNLSP